MLGLFDALITWKLIAIKGLNIPKLGIHFNPLLIAHQGDSN